jgi:hypothetical protein
MYRRDCVAGRQVGQLDAPRTEKGAVPHEEGVGPLARNCCKGRIDLVACARLQNFDLQSQGRAHPFQAVKAAT